MAILILLLPRKVNTSGRILQTEGYNSCIRDCSNGLVYAATSSRDECCSAPSQIKPPLFRMRGTPITVTDVTPAVAMAPVLHLDGFSERGDVRTFAVVTSTWLLPAPMLAV